MAETTIILTKQDAQDYFEYKSSKINNVNFEALEKNITTSNKNISANEKRLYDQLQTQKKLIDQLTRHNDNQAQIIDTMKNQIDELQPHPMTMTEIFADDLSIDPEKKPRTFIGVAYRKDYRIKYEKGSKYYSCQSDKDNKDLIFTNTNGFLTVTVRKGSAVSRIWVYELKRSKN